MSGQIVDLSHPMSSDMPFFTGDPAPRIDKLAKLERDGYNATKLELHSHLGTHIDAPWHILENGKSLDEFSLQNYTGEGICIDVSGENNISAEGIKKRVGLGAFEFLLLYTGWDKHWNTPNYFTNFPCLHQEATELICSYGIKAVGIDTPSFDPMNEQLTNHKLLLGKNILLIENLCNLRLVLLRKFEFFCFPLNYSKADGSPVRACAKLIQ